MGAVGQRVRMQNGEALVTGRATFTADVRIPAVTHMAVLRSPHAHARLVSVDCVPARTRPGVLAAVSGAELARDVGPLPPHFSAVPLGGKGGDVRCLAVEKVRYVGEPVAVVVAETEADAVAALDSIVVEYEPLPAVVNAGDALATGASLLYDEWGDNVMLDAVVAEGTYEPAAAVADHRLSGRVEVPRSVPGPMETRSYVADWDARGDRLTWHGSTQSPHQLRWVLATLLGVSEPKVRVVSTTVGGSFGLKLHTHGEEILVAHLSRLVGRPVRWIEKREECMLLGGREQSHEFDAAYDDDGTIRAVRVRTVIDHGALSAGAGWGMAFVGALTFPNGYAVDHCEVRYKIAVTNKAPWSPVRGYGKEQAHLVMESLVDAVADRTGLDPLAVRRKNFIPADAFPYKTSAGFEIDSGNYAGLADLVAERFGYQEARAEQARRRSAGVAVGIGIGFELNPEASSSPGILVGGPYDSATIRISPTGEVSVRTGVTSPGTGNETGIAQIVSDRLGIPIDLIDVRGGDTDIDPYGFGNMASRSIVMGGGAAALAADELALKLRTVAARMLKAEPEEIRLADGQATVADASGRSLPIPDVAYAVYTLSRVLGLGLEPSLEVTKTYGPSNLRHVPNEDGKLQTLAVFSNALHMSLVEVDLETGQVALLRHVVADDCGTVINPMFVEGQVQGSTVAGLGAALGEQVPYDADGRPVADSFKTYLLRRANDLPTIEVLHQSTPSPVSALGTKGVGETGVGGAAAAVLNAVNDALRPHGASLHKLPLTPPSVLAAVREADVERRQAVSRTGT
jgi:carbon-monoxide dehydrogenase large subunit